MEYSGHSSPSRRYLKGRDTLASEISCGAIKAPDLRPQTRLDGSILDDCRLDTDDMREEAARMRRRVSVEEKIRIREAMHAETHLHGTSGKTITDDFLAREDVKPLVWIGEDGEPDLKKTLDMMRLKRDEVPSPITASVPAFSPDDLRKAFPELPVPMAPLPSSSTPTPASILRGAPVSVLMGALGARCFNDTNWSSEARQALETDPHLLDGLHRICLELKGSNIVDNEVISEEPASSPDDLEAELAELGYIDPSKEKRWQTHSSTD